jgi:SM-20-related protein
MSLRVLNYEAFNAAALVADPFKYLIVPNFVCAEAHEQIHRDFPQIANPGSFPLGALTYGPSFRDLIRAVRSSDFCGAVEQKFWR